MQICSIKNGIAIFVIRELLEYQPSPCITKVIKQNDPYINYLLTQKHLMTFNMVGKDEIDTEGVIQLRIATVAMVII